MVPRGGRAAPAWGGCAQTLSSPFPVGQGCSHGGLRDAECSRAALWGAQSPPPLCQGCPRASPVPAVRVLGPVKQQDGSRLGERGTGESLKEEFLIWNSLPLASPLGAVSTIPKTHGFTPWPAPGASPTLGVPHPSPPGDPRILLPPCPLKLGAAPDLGGCCKMGGLEGRVLWDGGKRGGPQSLPGAGGGWMPRGAHREPRCPFLDLGGGS